MDTHEVLVAARNAIDREGWIQFALESPDGMCARGGLMCVGRRSISEGMDRQAARDLIATVDLALAAHLPSSPLEGANRAPAEWVERYGSDWARAVCRIADFNNAEGRTKEEVLAAFDKAIAATAPEPYVELETPVEMVA